MSTSKDASYVTVPTEDKQSNETSVASTNTVACAEAQAVVVPETSESQSYDFLMNDLTWTDDYYANEDDIVAVFDMDAETSAAFFRRLASKYTAATVLLYGVTDLFAVIDIPELITLFTVCFGICLVLAAALIVKACRVTPNSSHMALTSTTLRYDVEQSMSQQTPIRNIVSCTIKEFKGRTYWIFGKMHTFNSIQLDITGGKKPLLYRDLKSPQNFQKVLVQLQQRQQA